jgi:histidinol phosphatase-like enzyme
MNRSAHFFDLGGTLLALDNNNEIAYDRHGRATILPGVRERLSTLVTTPVFVVTNQAGIAEGTLTIEQFNRLRLGRRLLRVAEHLRRGRTAAPTTILCGQQVR